MDRLRSMLQRLGLDGFILAIGCAVLLAWLLPQGGMIKKPVSLEELANYGVAGVFFFYGLKLNRDKLTKGLANWRMHALIQATTFVFFPLLVLILEPLFRSGDARQLWLGIFFLAALPSTVSSSVVMVSIAGGNIPSAIFNASISALIGVFVTPLWVGCFVNAGSGGPDAGDVIVKLLLQGVLPVALGMLMNRRYGAFADTHKEALRKFDQSIILVIIYTSFCKSFAMHAFENLGIVQLLLLAAGMLALFFAVLFIVSSAARMLGFNRGDSITVMFCASKKSLVHGSVMAGILFAGSSIAGFILLPLMLYHALQLIAASLLARRMAKSAGH